MATPESTSGAATGGMGGSVSPSSSTAVPYIGSHISLISRSDIRYEGTLYTINPKESTVSLSNVRMFGTEGRRGGSEEIAPRNEIYEYIIFRGSDIKDLTVCEPPPQPPVAVAAQPSSLMFPPMQMSTQSPFADTKQKDERISLLDQPKLQSPLGGGSPNSAAVNGSIQKQQPQQPQQQLPSFNPYTAGGFGPYAGVPQPGFSPYGFTPYPGMFPPYGPPGMFGAAPQYPPGVFPGQNPATAPRPQPPQQLQPQQQQQQQQLQPQLLPQQQSQQRTAPLPVVSTQPLQQPPQQQQQQQQPKQSPPSSEPPQAQQRAQPPDAVVVTAPAAQPPVSSVAQRASPPAVIPAQTAPPPVTSTKKPDTTPVAPVATTTPVAPVSTASPASSAVPTLVSTPTEISGQQHQEQMVSSGAQPTSEHVEYERKYSGGHRYHHWRGGRGGRPSTSSAFTPNKARFTEDFDFESANARFDKEKLLEEMTQDGGNKSSGPIAPAYSKTSFFDNISCETLERSHEDQDGGRSRSYRAQESDHRRNDTETFGRYQGPRYHGGGGYRGGRGGYRGGRGGGQQYQYQQPQYQQPQYQQPQYQHQQFHRHTRGARYHSNNANDMKENRSTTTRTGNE